MKDVLSFVSVNDVRLRSGKTVAKILHGLPSPGYTVGEWNRCGLWFKYGHVEFGYLSDMADQCLREVRTRKFSLKEKGDIGSLKVGEDQAAEIAGPSELPVDESENVMDAKSVYLPCIKEDVVEEL